jgi:hypothetical protein
MILAAAVLLTAQIQQPVVWYGPVTATFNIALAGNPFDPQQNDLRVRFVPEKGQPEERLAYLDEAGNVRAHLVTKTPGKYKPVLLRNGRELVVAPEEGIVDARRRLANGFLRIDPVHKNRFRWDSGETYFPVGFNLGWQNPDLPPLTDQISQMAGMGANWTRIWACNWDGKNPWWPNQEDADLVNGQLWLPALARWQEIVAACDIVGLPFQMVLFNHGSFSSRVNANWQDHPWNAEKGGFLKDGADFFTDPEAKRRSKMWLRYAVARYAHSPNLKAWELFNEVEWTDARYADRWHDIAAWHKEMAGYLRSIDPYGHLITSSSELGEKEMWASLDYYQPHVYSSNLAAAIAGRPALSDKPYFFGEIGPNSEERAEQVRAIRDGLYAGILANHAGAGQYWYWDRVHKFDLYGEFMTARKVLDRSGLASRPQARRLNVRARTGERTTLEFGPGAGWEKAGRTTFHLPDDATPEALFGLPAYFQSSRGDNRGLFPGPLEFKFNAPTAGKFEAHVDESASAGASLRLWVNGEERGRKEFAPGDSTVPQSHLFEASFPAGDVTIRFENDGADWVRFSRFSFQGIAPMATVMALGESDWMMMRLTAKQGTPTVDLEGVSLFEGEHRAEIVDLATGEVEERIVTLSQSGYIRGFRMPARDVVVILRK